MTGPRNIVRGQAVPERLADRSRELRTRMTSAEEMLWQHLRGRNLAGLRFRRQQVIGPFIADFYCHEAALVIEVDGPIHDADDIIERDDMRDQAFAQRGLRSLHITNDQITRDLPTVLERIQAIAKEQRPT